MTGVHAHIQLPAEDPGLLREYASLLERHGAKIDPVYAQRCRDKADVLEADRAKPITATSPIALLASHGVSARAIIALEGRSITTVGQLCELDANTVGRIIGFKKSRAHLCAVLARFLMGLRPIPDK